MSDVPVAPDEVRQQVIAVLERRPDADPAALFRAVGRRLGRDAELDVLRALSALACEQAIQLECRSEDPRGTVVCRIRWRDGQHP